MKLISNPEKMINVTVAMGSNIYHVANQAIELAKARNCKVHFVFNDIHVIVNKDSTGQEACEDYENQRRK
jgi:hypothetical protein